MAKMCKNESLLLEQSIELFDKGEVKSAGKLLAKIKTKTNDVALMAMKIAYKEQKYQKSILIAKQLLASKAGGEQQFSARKYLATSLVKLGYKEEAIVHLESVCLNNITIDNAPYIFSLCQLYLDHKLLRRLEALAPKMLSWQRYFGKASILLLNSAALSGNKKYLTKRASELLPYLADLNNKELIYLAEIFMRLYKYDEAAKVITVYQGKFKLDFSACLWAKLALAKKEYQEVISLLTDEIVKAYGPLYYAKAKAYKELGNYEQAFTCLTLGAEHYKELIKKEKVLDYTIANKRVLPKLSFAKLTGDKFYPFTHVFTFGFPRSGTTMLDNILATQSEVTVLSEMCPVSRVVESFSMRLSKRYPQDLDKLTSDDIDILIMVYFKAIEELGIDIPESGWLVDKHPFHTTHLPLIKILFPHAKLICSIRHPLDVCLSCFEIDFALWNETRQLLSLNDITSRYNAFFSLLEEFEQCVGQKVLYVKYENLVADIAKEMAKVFDYIDLQPNEDYKVFYEKMSDKYVTSASRGQTDQPVYQTSVEKWKQYEQELLPYKNKLAHFLEKFAYT